MSGECLSEERLIELSEEEAAPAEEAHLRDCPSCRRQLEALQAGNQLFESLKQPGAAPGLGFGFYHDCREIGSGAMSRVYRARGPDGAAVAVKVCRDPALLDGFRNEVKLLRHCQELGLPGVVPLLAADLEHLPAYLVTPLFERGSLAQNPPAGPAALRELALRLARILADLAAQGVVHGDLKPSNILIDASVQPWVADLGGARRPRP